jgi:tetratricopeptide (TPR) repeat protein
VDIDRDATLKRAETLVRQGRLEAAIAEYVRVTSAHPGDWNALNALGDLYLRAGQVDRAVIQFARVGDHLAGEGSFARAAAVYKKILRISPDDARGTRGLEALAEKQARARWSSKNAQAGAPDDPDARMMAAREAQDASNVQEACALLIEAADLYEAQGRLSDALAAVAEASSIEPVNSAYRLRMLNMLIAQGELAQARCVARIVPELLMVADALELAGRRAEAADTIAEAALVDPDNRLLRERGIDTSPEADGGASRGERLPTQAVTAVAQSGPGHADEAFARVDGDADAALSAGNWNSAVRLLQDFVATTPHHVPALLKLIEVCVERGLKGVMGSAQEQLVDAYLRVGRGAEARIIAEDLVIRAPWERSNVERLLRALVLCGEPEPEETIATLLCADGSLMLEDL